MRFTLNAKLYFSIFNSKPLCNSISFIISLKSLENEVSNAKRSGKYDVGIRTLTGHSVEVISTVYDYSIPNCC